MSPPLLFFVDQKTLLSSQMKPKRERKKVGGLGLKRDRRRQKREKSAELSGQVVGHNNKSEKTENGSEEIEKRWKRSIDVYIYRFRLLL